MVSLGGLKGGSLALVGLFAGLIFLLSQPQARGIGQELRSASGGFQEFLASPLKAVGLGLGGVGGGLGQLGRGFGEFGQGVGQAFAPILDFSCAIRPALGLPACGRIESNE